MKIVNKYVPTERQAIAHRAPNRYKLYGGSMGGGKKLPLDTGILTPSGFVKLYDLNEGDVICNPDGTLQTVVKMHEITDEEQYIFHLNNGAEVSSCGEHLWYGGWRRDKSDFTDSWDNPNCIKTSKQIYEHTVKQGGKRKLFKIPTPDAVVFGEDVDKGHIDPYLLGVLLGDGCITNKAFLKITTNDIEHTRETLNDLGLSHRVVKFKNKNCYDVIFNYEGKKHIIREASRLGLLGLDHTEKFIPDEYKFCSVNDRLSILQGLLDTDGCLDRNNGSVKFYSVNERLANDVAFVARSLGCYASISFRRGRMRNDYMCSDCYVVFIASKDNSKLFRIKRKSQLAKKRKVLVSNIVESVELVKDKKPMRCITVSNPNGLYIIDDFIVSHNTVWLCAEVIELMLQYPGNRAIMCRNTLKDFKDTTLVTLLKFFREFLSEELLVGGSFENGHNKSECTISLKNGSVIKYTGLSDEDGVKTLKSFECGVFALDEASEIAYDNFKIATTRLRWKLPDGSHPAFYGLLASNPEDCWLKDVFVSGKGGSDYLFIPALPSDNPHNPDGYVAQMVKDMGGDEAFIKRYIEGSWDDVATANFVIPPSLVEQAVDKVLPVVRKPVMGVDVAREGLDETVIYYGMGNTLKDWDYAHQRKVDETVMRVLEMSKKHMNPSRICVDDIGVGGGVTDFLRKYGARVTGVNVGTRSEDKRFFNKKAELWWHARTQFMDGKVSIPRDDKLIRQLSGVQYRYRGTGKIIVEPKDETKRRLGQSPDRADAFILMLHAARSIGELSRDFKRNNTVNIMGQNGGDAYGWDRFYGVENAPEYNYTTNIGG